MAPSWPTMNSLCPLGKIAQLLEASSSVPVSVQEVSGKYHSSAVPGAVVPKPDGALTLASELCAITGFGRPYYNQPQVALVLMLSRLATPAQAPHGPRPAAEPS